MPITVAVDAMGGDRAPEEIVAGAVEAAAELGVRVLLVGLEHAVAPLLPRGVTGVELVGDLAARSASVGDVRLYLLGGAGDTAKRGAETLRRLYPGAAIAGVRDGYFSDAQSDAVAAAVGRLKRYLRAHRPRSDHHDAADLSHPWTS